LQVSVAAFIGAFACQVIFNELAGASKTARYVGGFIIGLVVVVVLGFLLDLAVAAFHRLPR